MPGGWLLWPTECPGLGQCKDPFLFAPAKVFLTGRRPSTRLDDSAPTARSLGRHAMGASGSTQAFSYDEARERLGPSETRRFEAMFARLCRVGSRTQDGRPSGSREARGRP